MLPSQPGGMSQNLELNEHKQKVATVYNLASSGYDKPALQFFPRTAGRLVEQTRLRTGDRVLDVGTGTGAAAFAAASKVGPSGKVLGVDIGAEILEQARRKLDLLNESCLSFSLGDMECLEFPDQTFDTVLSTSTIFFLQDMLVGLREWKRVVKAGGCLAVSGYGEAAFRPLSDLFEARIRTYGVQLPAARPFSWQRLTEPEQYLALFRQAGLVNVEVFAEQLGYYLESEEAWWDVVWNSGFRGPVSKLNTEALVQFKTEHLAEVKKLLTPKGLWLDVASIFAIGHTV